MAWWFLQYTNVLAVYSVSKLKKAKVNISQLKLYVHTRKVSGGSEGVKFWLYLFIHKR